MMSPRDRKRMLKKGRQFWRKVRRICRPDQLPVDKTWAKKDRDL